MTEKTFGASVGHNFKAGDAVYLKPDGTVASAPPGTALEHILGIAVSFPRPVVEQIVKDYAPINTPFLEALGEC